MKLDFSHDAGFIETPLVTELCERAMTYLAAGMAIHLSGPSGSGKTTLALHLASLLGRPAMMLRGGEGPAADRVNVVQPPNRLPVAAQHGYTVVFDDFLRADPALRAPFLDALDGCAHPDFRAIFTSHPEDPRDSWSEALLDRVVTLTLGSFDRETEVEIVTARTAAPREEVETVVDLVRLVRFASQGSHLPSLRAAMAIARVLTLRGASADPADRHFRWACRDVLGTSLSAMANATRLLPSDVLDDIVVYLHGQLDNPEALTRAA